MKHRSAIIERRAAKLRMLRREIDRLEAREATLSAARNLNAASGMLAGSVLLDSALEHYRGSFKNPAMFTPLAIASLTLGVSAHGTADRRLASHRVREISYAAGAATGLLGFLFHTYNVLKRPGRLAWQNLFYGAPIGAPFAILLSGLLGSAAERIRNSPPGRARVLGLPAGRLMAAVTGIGLLGTAGEAGLLHFRGAFQNPFMYAPVTLPPLGGVVMLREALRTGRRERAAAGWLMRAIAALGFAGVGFHAWGIQRSMGGWRNWSQNVLDGPPLPAPPSFTGLAMAGLAALRLLAEHPDA